MTAAILWGAGLGAFIALLSAWLAFDRDRSFYPAVIIVIAAYYVLFAVQSGNAQAILIETGVALVFAATAVAGYRWRPMIVAAAILAHAAYDAVHHLIFPDHGAPAWWPGFCGAIDAVLALAAALAVSKLSKQR